MLGGFEAEPQFQRLEIEQEKTSRKRWKRLVSPYFLLFLPACLSCSLSIYQLSVRFNLIVGSLLPPLDLCNTPTTNMSIPDVPFPVLKPTLIRSPFQTKPATLLIYFPLFFS